MDISRLSKAHGKQSVNPGLGKPYSSPPRRRSAKTKIIILPDARKIATLKAKIALLRSKSKVPTSGSLQPDETEADWVDDPEPSIPFHAPTERRMEPGDPAKRLARTWKALIPNLVGPMNLYWTSTLGKPIQPISSQLVSKCISSCIHKSYVVTALFYDREVFFSLSDSIFILIQTLRL